MTTASTSARTCPQPARRAERVKPADQAFDAQVEGWGIVATYSLCGGDPRIDGRHIRVRDVVQRFLAGESVLVVARDLGLSVKQVEDALRFHLTPERRKSTWRDRQLMHSAREGT